MGNGSQMVRGYEFECEKELLEAMEILQKWTATFVWTTRH
jgi:hypothetical protein